MSQESDRNAAIERIDLQSLDVAEEKPQKLPRLFPEVRTEGGTIDFYRLKDAGTSARPPSRAAFALRGRRPCARRRAAGVTNRALRECFIFSYLDIGWQGWDSNLADPLLSTI